MIRPLFFIFTLLFILPFNIKSQVPCGTNLLMETTADDYYTHLNDQVRTYYETHVFGQDRSTLTIPVVFHVVYQTPEQNIHDSLIFQQLTRMNEDFQRTNPDTVNTPAPFKPVSSGMDIEFCLAHTSPDGSPRSGILRVETTTSSFPSPVSYDVPDPVKHTSLGGSDAWDTEHFLNIWICNLTGATAYSAPPGNFAPEDDGVVCHFNHIGNSGVYPYDFGRSIIHEIGHFFGLKHIWGDDGTGCEGTDYMGDTPNQSGYNTNCPDFPVLDACSTEAPGVMFMNYMDYTNDHCRNMFTLDQVSYMWAVIELLLPGYLDGYDCEPAYANLPTNSQDYRLYYTTTNVVVEFVSPITAVKIFSLDGKLVDQSDVYLSTLYLERGMYPKGVYILQFENQQMVVGTEKIVL